MRILHTIIKNAFGIIAFTEEKQLSSISKPTAAKRGVPHVSILRPLLFWFMLMTYIRVSQSIA